MRQVLRLLRRTLYAREGTEPDVCFGSRRGAQDGGPGVHGDSVPGTECELVARFFGANVFCGTAGGGGRVAWDSAGEIYYFASARLYAGYCAGNRCDAYVV